MLMSTAGATELFDRQLALVVESLATFSVKDIGEIVGVAKTLSSFSGPRARIPTSNEEEADR